MCKVRPSKFLDEKIMSGKANQLLLRRMFNWPIEGVRDSQKSLHKSLFTGVQYAIVWGPNLFISCRLNILLIYHFEVIWACPLMPDQDQLICHPHAKNPTLWRNSSLRYWTSWTSANGRLRATLVITQELEICQT